MNRNQKARSHVRTHARTRRKRQWFPIYFAGAEAFDGGDTVALLLGLIIGISGILACLGAYARRKGMAWTMNPKHLQLLSFHEHYFAGLFQSAHCSSSEHYERSLCIQCLIIDDWSKMNKNTRSFTDRYFKYSWEPWFTIGNVTESTDS